MDRQEDTIDQTAIEKVRAYLSDLSNQRRASAEATAVWLFFYHKCDPMIRQFAAKLGVPSSGIDDCTQEVWLELVARLGEFNYDAQRGQFASWLYILVRNKTVDLYRGQARRATAPLTAASALSDSKADPAGDCVRSEARQMVRRTLSKVHETVGEKNRKLMEMRWMDGISVDQVAETLGLTRRQVWFRQHRLKQKLSGMLAG